MGKKVKDALGDRMKKYERSFSFTLQPRTYTIIRIDGKAFHTYTKGLQKPFDSSLMEDMNATAAYLCKNISGTKLAFIQSDEISLVLTDFEDIKTQAWFDGTVQKVCSVSASMATRAFNEARLKRLGVEKMRWAEFDARVFQISQKIEVTNYLIWRQQDATKNSISMVSHTLYSTEQLKRKNSNEQQEMQFQKGVNWNDFPSHFKRGRSVIKTKYEVPNTVNPNEKTLRSKWDAVEVPIFTKDRQFLLNLIPNNFECE